MSFTRAGDDLVAALGAGLYEAGTIVMGESQILVPVEFGILKGSGHVGLPDVEADSVSVTVGYGYGAAYEARVGEQFAHDPDAEHAYGYWVHQVVVRADGHVVQHKPPTQARFLEVPAEAMRGELPGILETAVAARKVV